MNASAVRYPAARSLTLDANKALILWLPLPFSTWQRRVADQDGDTRRVLESKLSELIKAYADRLGRIPPDRCRSRNNVCDTRMRNAGRTSRQHRQAGRTPRWHPCGRRQRRPLDLSCPQATVDSSCHTSTPMTATASLRPKACPSPTSQNTRLQQTTQASRIKSLPKIRSKSMARCLCARSLAKSPRTRLNIALPAALLQGAS